jgi:peptidoglycan hydrolase-like amidase
VPCLFLAGALLVCALSGAQSARSAGPAPHVRIGVLGLFHTVRFEVSAPLGAAIVLHAGQAPIVLEKTSGTDSATILISGKFLLVSAGKQIVKASKLTASGRDGEPVDFILAVPEKIARRYHGTLELKPDAGVLTAVVDMDRETAVASVVAAESAPDTPLEALEAQAVAARSYLTASRGRHQGFDFCDTTHCQFLREAPAPNSASARAAAATRSLVLSYRSQPVAAMYTRSCAGRTRTPGEVGLSQGAYPYYSVECTFCRAHPARWSSRISAQNAALLRASDDPARLNIDRRLGWSAVPSNDFVANSDGDQVVLNGTGQGHGIGLCQSGAQAMAENGWDFQQILNHYYPNTTLTTAPGRR